MPKFSVKKPYVVVVAVVMLLVLGVVSFTKMTTDFLPNMNMPYMMVITTYPGASPEKVEAELTTLMEAGVSTVNGVKNVASTSSENYSMIMLEFEDDTNMDSAMVKVSSAVNQMELPENVGNPMIMEISADMMPVIQASIDYEGKDAYELTKFVDEVVIPELERQDGVASVNASGMIEKSVEVALDQDKIDDVNGKILEKTDSTLKDAKEKIDDAQEKLDDGKEELEEQMDNLAQEQENQSSELAKFSKMMNQALANKEAYASQVTSLKASKTALQTEKKAYKKNKIEETYQQINQSFAAARANFQPGGAGYEAIYSQVYNQVLIAAVQTAMDQAGSKVTVTAANVDQLLGQLGDAATSIKNTAAQTAASTTKTQAEAQLANIPEDIKDALENPDKLTAFKTMLEQQGQAEAAKGMNKKTLQSLYDIVNTRLPQIETALANLKIEIQTAKAVLAQVEKSIKKAEAQYEKVEAGKITAAAAFGSANAQMTSAKSALETSEKELKEAKKSYEKSRKEALKKANLDELLTMDKLSGILTAENFSMPAGYISEDGTQYLIKVGDEYNDLEELENTLLVNIKDIGDIRLNDVANITIIDNAADSYAKVDGNDAVIISVSKSSTAGTSTVSKECNEAIEKLQKDNEGLRIVNLMDQGDYIELIVDSVLSNLLWGALLAIIVLIIFLKDVKPTAVVAFSIPMSVLFAIVLMFFTDITLNIISLSGLALGVGMLVDNSIVVIENIYRLRSKGISAARAAVMGANQMAGAIFSSTLTTVCVFLPIIFTDGLTRSIMQDMCLTITYSLMASLIVALTLVPCMSSTVLKNCTEKKHRWFDAMVNGYEKIAGFCLKRKVVPIVISVALLVFCIIQVFRMGMVIVPSMGSEQLSMTVVMPAENSSKEDYETADEIISKVSEIEGVDTIGGVMTSSASIGSTSDKDYTFMLLLKEDYFQKNTEIAGEIEKVLEEMELEDFSVSESNMDMSAMLGSGLQVNISGKDNDKLIEISEDIMEIVGEIEGFEEITNGQEAGDEEVIVTVDKDKAMRKGLTVAQVYQELAAAVTTEKDSTSITVDEAEYDVKIVDAREELNTKNLEDYEFEVTTTNEKGEPKTKTYKLSQFADIKRGKGVTSLARENLVNYVTVSATVKEGENIALLSRDLEDKLDKYDTPDGYEIEMAGETESINDMVKNMLLMITLAIIFIYLIMVAQFQSLLSPFIVIFTIPLAFTGGLLALLLSGQELSMMALMGFLLLCGVIVNNGIVFVDYVNQLRLSGMEKKEALIETGKTRMRPILMTALTTVLSMSILAVSQDMSADMSRGMAIVTIGGLLYGTLMTLFIVPVLYDIFFRKELKAVDLGDEETLNDMNE